MCDRFSHSKKMDTVIKQYPILFNKLLKILDILIGKMFSLKIISPFNNTVIITYKSVSYNPHLTGHEATTEW